MADVQFCILVLMLFLSMLQTLLIAIKLLGQSPLTWWQTLSPLGIPTLFALGTAITYIIIAWVWYLIQMCLQTQKDKQHHE